MNKVQICRFEVETCFRLSGDATSALTPSVKRWRCSLIKIHLKKCEADKRAISSHKLFFLSQFFFFRSDFILSYQKNITAIFFYFANSHQHLNSFLSLYSFIIIFSVSISHSYTCPLSLSLTLHKQTVKHSCKVTHTHTYTHMHTLEITWLLKNKIAHMIDPPNSQRALHAALLM